MLRKYFILLTALFISACSHDGLRSKLLISGERKELQQIIETLYDKEDKLIFDTASAIDRSRDYYHQRAIELKEQFGKLQNKESNDVQNKIYKKYHPKSLGIKNKSVTWLCGATELIRGDGIGIAYYPEYCSTDPGLAWNKQERIWNKIHDEKMDELKHKQKIEFENYTKKLDKEAEAQYIVNVEDERSLLLRIAFEQEILSALLIKTISNDNDIAFTDEEVTDFLSFLRKNNAIELLNKNKILGDLAEKLAEKMNLFE